MCCHLNIKDIGIFLSVIHIIVGIILCIFLGKVIGAIWVDDFNKLLGILYGIYFLIFLILGFVILFSLRKEIRVLLKWAIFAFILVQLYLIGLETTFYGNKFPAVPEKENFSRAFMLICQDENMIHICQICITLATSFIYTLILLMNLRRISTRRYEDDDDLSIENQGYSNLC